MRNKNIKSYIKKNGTRAYKFKVYLGSDPITGKRIETTRRGFKTAREAQRALDRLRVDYDKNGWRNGNKLNVKTVDDLFNAWFEAKKGNVKNTSLSTYQVPYVKHLKPVLGNIKLDKLSPYILQKTLNNLGKKYSNMVRFTRTLNMLFRYAVKMEIMTTNPMDKVDRPKGKESAHADQVNYYNKEELTNFLKTVKENGDFKKYAYFRLLAYTGMRRGESLALSWGDFDFENKTIDINKNIVYDSLEKQTKITTPKTKTSKRVLFLDDKTVSVLQKWHLEQSKWIMRHGFIYHGDKQPIFQSTSNGFCPSETANKWLSLLYKKFPQKKISVHGFRHTHASLLFESGATIKEVQDRLGHATSKETLDIYAHVMESRRSGTGERFAKYMGN